MSDLTTLLQAAAQGDQAARDEAFRLVYSDLKDLAARVAGGAGPQYTLDTTGLVHESFLRLAKSAPSSREHFFALAARAMRQILCDHARRRIADKRGKGAAPVELTPDLVAAATELETLVAIDDLFDQLSAADARAARAIELRVFGGLSVTETADVLGVSPRTVQLDVDRARTWLAPRLSP
ncbi:MAG: ECF-type sigma factor [Myxococcota bacterium]